MPEFPGIDYRWGHGWMGIRVQRSVVGIWAELCIQGASALWAAWAAAGLMGAGNGVLYGITT
jgi:hypothetical protein